MVPPTFPELFRQARKNKRLSQRGLAAKLGLGQSQVSDLERGAVDPRLSTLQDVARGLDLELMLIPRPLISTVDGLLRGATAAATAQRPLYTLDEPEPLDENKEPVSRSKTRRKRSDRSRQPQRRNKPKRGMR